MAAGAVVLPTQPEEFRALIEKEIPVGTSVAEAKSRVETLGLACSLVRGGWTNNSGDRTAFYFCQRTSGTLVLTRWKVSFLPEQEKVSGVRADVVLVGP